MLPDDLTDNNLIVQILEAYDLAPPVELFVLVDQGVNNTVRGIQTGAGTFVLKSYQTHASMAAMEYEHRLLIWLAHSGIPFMVPAPLPGRNGTALNRTAQGWQALFPWLPGATGEHDRPAHVQAAGLALGILHAVLKQYPAEPHPGVGPFGNLSQIHPSVPDPLQLFKHMRGPSVDGQLLAWWRTEISALQEFVDGVYRALPTQVIHGDFVLGNLLFRGASLVAVLDWEFAVLDTRAMDIATLLVAILFANGDQHFASSASLVASGYRQSIQLTSAEVEALPWLIRLWNAVNLIWRVGQDPAYSQQRPVQLDRLLRAQQTAEWLKYHAEDVTRPFSA